MTIPRVLSVICLAVGGLVAFSFLKAGQNEVEGPAAQETASADPAPAMAPVAPEEFTEADFRRSLMESANSLREKRGYRALSADPRIEQWLLGSKITCANLQAVLASADLPDFQALRAGGAAGGALRELLPGLLDNLSTPASDREDRFGMLFRSLPGGEQEVIIVTGESLPELTLAGLEKGSIEAFVSQCAHCGKRSAYQNKRNPTTLILTCPSCQRCTRLLGRDTKGLYHDAPAFLIASPCPAPAAGSHPLDAMLSIWQAAVRRCRYVEDGDSEDTPTDSWQTPKQTLRKGTGDCEDSALLLTDWMLSNKIPARMAVGTMEGGGHAWCIVRVDKADYLLESTNRLPDPENLPVVNPNDGYVPTALFDREALHVRAHPEKPFDGDYWSPEKWIRLPRAKAKAAAAAEAKPAVVAKEP
jgi:predicted transglutaminase-like cysteine proteinase